MVASSWGGDLEFWSDLLKCLCIFCCIWKCLFVPQGGSWTAGEQLAQRREFISTAWQEEFYQGSSCPKHPLLSISAIGVNAGSRSSSHTFWVPLAFTSPQQGSWHTAVTKTTLAFRTCLAYNSDWPVHFGNTHFSSGIVALGATLAHWEKCFPLATPAWSKGVVGGLGSWYRSASFILSHVPSSVASMPCCMGQGGARSENIPLMYQKFKQGCILPTVLLPKDQAVLFLQERCPGGPAPLLVGTAVLLLSSVAVAW